MPSKFQSKFQINQKLPLEIWTTAFLSTFIYSGVPKVQQFSLVGHWERFVTVAFFSNVEKEKWGGFWPDYYYMYGAWRSRKMFGDVPPTAGENTDHTQAIDRI